MIHPIYLKSYHSGNLEKIILQAREMLESCSLCPRRCKVNRLKNKRGFCQSGLKAKVCSYLPHHGEEPPISGKSGSGTIFFSHCNVGCVYCQNYEFSQEGEGRELEIEELAQIMLQLQDMGCHNINLVTPTHVMPQILEALPQAIKHGLKIPLCYNTSGYELANIIKLLDGIVDIYLTDMRYADNHQALKYSHAPDYPQYNQESVKEMHRQVGRVKLNESGIIKKGLIIRHLVLPNQVSGTEAIMRFISQELSSETYISLMSQYFPCYKAEQFPEISRKINFQEYEEAKDIMHKYGLSNGWTQDGGGLERFAGINIKPNL